LQGVSGTFYSEVKYQSKLKKHVFSSKIVIEPSTNLLNNMLYKHFTPEQKNQET